MKNLIVAAVCLLSAPAFAAGTKAVPKTKPATSGGVFKTNTLAAKAGGAAILNRFANVRENGTLRAIDMHVDNSKKINATTISFTLSDSGGETVQVKTFKVKGGWQHAKFGNVDESTLPDNS